MTSETKKSPKALGTFRLFFLCALVASSTAILISASGVLNRVELQSLNRMFEARQWLKWSPDGIKKLNPETLWNYHAAHEIPNRIWAWDYTLSWAIADNHPPVKNKIVIFNHMLEDEPPPDAVASHPWMKPLLQYPVPRSTVASTIRFLAQNGARLIILDNDFPQYSDQDKDLAWAIYEASSGRLSGKPVPVLMASTVNRRSFNGGLQLDGMTMPVGVLDELQKLEPNVDVVEKYTGLTTILLDQDQVVRRIACTIPDDQGKRESIVVKTMKLTGQRLGNLPDIMDIDFGSVPNSELYPVRPFSYLLDPDAQKRITSPTAGDVNIDGAIVLLGDSVQDVYPTPLTNEGMSLMSGSEILAHSIETISRASWLQRLDANRQSAYLIICCLIATGIFSLTRSIASGSKRATARLAADWILCVTLSVATYFAAYYWFAFAGLIVPAVVPAIAVALGTLAGVLYERERERIQSMLTRLTAMEATLKAERETHDAQLRFHEAEAQAKEVLLDQQRRREFVRRINHDLKAPVTVLNWTLAKLKREGLQSATADERLEHIERTSDRLFGLIAELVHSYDQNAMEKTITESTSNEVTDICVVVANCVQMQSAIAELRESHIVLDLPNYPMVSSCAKLQLERIMDNLLRNALLHNPPGTTVEISARTRANAHQISISDNGLGIAADKLPQLFAPEYTTSTGDGEGLGLSIVKTLVERLGGTVSVESEHEVGSSFVISLPVTGAAVAGVLDPQTDFVTTTRTLRG